MIVNLLFENSMTTWKMKFLSSFRIRELWLLLLRSAIFLHQEFFYILRSGIYLVFPFIKFHFLTELFVLGPQIFQEAIRGQ